MKVNVCVYMFVYLCVFPRYFGSSVGRWPRLFGSLAFGSRSCGRQHLEPSIWQLDLLSNASLVAQQ